MKVKNIILAFAVMVGMVIASDGDEHRSLATGCRSITHRRTCKNTPRCEWRLVSSGMRCRRRGTGSPNTGCRRKSMNQCKNASNCEWRKVASGQMRCRPRNVTDSDTGSTTGNWQDTIDKIPQNIRDDLAAQLSKYRHNPNALCFEKPQSLVSETVQATGADYHHGGYNCWRFYHNILIGNKKENCVCRDDMSPTIVFPDLGITLGINLHGGLDCSCW